MTEPGLPCIEVVELVSAYLEGELEPDLHRRVEQHLHLCPACLIYVEQVRETVQSLGELPAGALPEDAISELEAAFREFPRGRT